jgi:uncharacterized protein
VTLIIDTAPIVALGDSKDQLHADVLRVLKAESGNLIIPAPVTAEVDYLLRARAGARTAHLFLQDVADGKFQVEGLTQDEHALAVELDGRYSDIGVGLADLSVVILAHRFGTQRILTFDQRHFRALQPLSGGHFCILPSDR